MGTGETPKWSRYIPLGNQCMGYLEIHRTGTPLMWGGLRMAARHHFKRADIWEIVLD